MLSLVIDIQSDVVEGTLVEFPNKKESLQIPHIIYSASLHIPRKAHATGSYLAKTMLNTVEELSLGIVREIKSHTEESIQSVHFILSSPWVASRAKTLSITFDKDTQITSSTVHDLIETDRKELVEKSESDMIIVEQKIFDILLNGYSVEKYQGKHARRLSVLFAYTLSSDKIVKRIQSAVARHLHVRKEYFHSAILLQYVSSRAMAAAGEEYMILHVHGELTDIVIVKKGFTSYLASFSFGTSTLTRKVCHSIRNTFEATCSTLTMYMDKRLDENEQKKIETALMPILKGWQTEFIRTCSGIGNDISLPRTIHFYSGSLFSPLFKKTLEESDFEVVIHDEPLREVHSFALKDVV